MLKKTKIVKKESIAENLAEAGEIIRRGGLVVFPTETVYGLGANALDERAVKSVFEAKGRPQDNPLIVHIAEYSQLEALVADVPEKAKEAIEMFWPGPLTLLFNRSPLVPLTTTGGLETVAIRMPDNQVALDLIKESGRPIAAPSANISGKPSPTNAEHVILDLFGKVDMIIDGGDTEFGMESTVLDLTGKVPTILRPGSVTKEQLALIFDDVEYDPALQDASSTPRSPGQKYKHYSPEAEVKVFVGDDESVYLKMLQEEARYISRGCNVCVLTVTENVDKFVSKNVLDLGSRDSLEDVAKNLFEALRKCDNLKADIIIAQGFEDKGIGKAIMNRLGKAAGGNVEHL